MKAAYLSNAFVASWSPCTTPSCIKAVFKTSCKAWFTSIGPPVGAAEGTSSLKQI